MEPQAYCDEIAEKFKATWARVGISNDDFIRTTEPRHEAAVAEMWKRLEAAGDIYEAEYDGMYCVGCETAKTEDDVDTENGQKVCKIHRTPVERVKEKNYFFRLSKYAPKLLEWYAQTPSPVQPESRRNEVRAFVEGGLRDLSVSRLKKSVGWGHPGPRRSGAHDLRLDRRADELPDRARRARRGRARRPARAAFWAAANHLDREGHPSLITPSTGRRCCERRPAAAQADLLPRLPDREGAEDLEVDHDDQDRSERDRRRAGRRSAALLRAARVHAGRGRRLHLRGAVPALRVRPRQRPRQPAEPNDLDGAQVRRRKSRRVQSLPGRRSIPIKKTIENAWEGFSPAEALSQTWSIVREGNRYIDEQKPWVLAKKPEDLPALHGVLGRLLETLRWAALLVAPAMPSAAKEILRQLGREQDEGTWPDKWGWPGGVLTEPKPVFPRVEPERQTALIDRWTAVPGGAPAAPPRPPRPRPPSPQPPTSLTRTSRSWSCAPPR